MWYGLLKKILGVNKYIFFYVTVSNPSFDASVVSREIEYMLLIDSILIMRINSIIFSFLYTEFNLVEQSSY